MEEGKGQASGHKLNIIDVLIDIIIPMVTPSIKLLLLLLLSSSSLIDLKKILLSKINHKFYLKRLKTIKAWVR